MVHANPHASLKVVVQGSVRADGAWLPPAFLSGSLTRPLATVVECPLQSATLVLQPGVLEPLFGVRPEALAGQCVEARQIASPRLRRWCNAPGDLAFQRGGAIHRG